ncbi:MAG: ABC transporter ATP-binding protein [Promethearchaeia archaeon]
MIETRNLSKIYKLKNKKEIIALDKINLNVKEGEIFGLLGPNGAGKTTLIKILTTLTQPTDGWAKLDGLDVVEHPKKVKSKISLMLESDMLYYRITGYDNLKFFCKIYKVPDYKTKINDLAEEFDLKKWLKEYVGQYSSGMKMKLALCRTLLINRKVLILDEPTLGLDVESTARIVNKLRKINKTIFLTSHDLNMVEKLCDRVAFINYGRILKIGTKEDIKKLDRSEIEINVTIENKIDGLREKLIGQDFITKFEKNKNNVLIGINHRKSYQKLLQILSEFPVLKIKENESTLEELFLKITKNETN